MVRPSAVIAISWVEPGMSMVAVMASVAASRKCTLWAVFAVTIRLGPPGRLLRSNIVALASNAKPIKAGGAARFKAISGVASRGDGRRHNARRVVVVVELDGL